MATPAAGVSTTEGSGKGAGEKIHSWLGAIPIGIAFILLAGLSWRKWPDPLIDFGQQLYVPWRLSRGAILYHDVSYVYGCLSVCYHALLFRIFGVSLNVLLASNFLLLLFLLAAVYGRFRKSSDGWTATVIGLALTVLAFGQFLDVGNYNYVCPYSHEEFHGIVLAVLMILCLTRWLQRGGRRLPAAAGVCAGLIFMTKPEIFVGAAAPFAVALLWQWRRRSLAEAGVALLTAAAAALIPLLGFYLGFLQEMGSADALRAVFGAWLPLRHSAAMQIPLYRAMTGLDRPWFHVWQALVETGGLAVVVGLCAWRLTRPTLKPLERALWLAAAGGASINYGWQNSGHCLPALLVIAAILLWREGSLAATRVQESGNLESASMPASLVNASSSPLFFPGLWLAFSAAMLVKLGLNPQIKHYGVFLAMPAFLSGIYLLLHLLPHFLAGKGLKTGTFRAAILIFLLAGLARLTIHSALFYKDKDFTLGSGGDRMVTYDPKTPKIDPTGAAMAAAATWIETHTAPTNTLAVLPEGVMLNYLTRRDNPTPYVVFAFEVRAFGEQTMLSAYEKNPPDYVVLIQRDSSEYGVRYFGQQKGYGLDVMEWVRQNYEPVELIGAEPLQTGAFGIKILKHLSPPAPAEPERN